MNIAKSSANGQRSAAYGVVSNADERLAHLYATHATTAARLAYVLSGDEHAAEDIAQEAFVRVGGRLLMLRDPERASGYLYRTVANLAKGHGRRLKRDRGLKGRLPPPDAQKPPDFGARDEMWRALMALPVRHRTALFLRYYLDMTEADAAEVLDCSTSAMKSLTHRAVESLRRNLQGAQS